MLLKCSDGWIIQRDFLLETSYDSKVPNSFQVQIFKERTIFEWLRRAKLYFTVFRGDQFYICGCVCIHLHVSFLPLSSSCSHPQHPKHLDIPKLGGRRSFKGLLQFLLQALWWHVGQFVKEQRDDQTGFIYLYGDVCVQEHRSPFLGLNFASRRRMIPQETREAQ